MKILLDPVYTTHPEQCSTSYLVWEIAERFAEVHPDAFFYVLVPKSHMDNENSLKFWDRLPGRVTLIPIDQFHKDRTRELYRYPDEIFKLLAPVTSRFWDVDFIFSSRIPQMANYRFSTARGLNVGRHSVRGVYGLDEMPLFSHRKTVPLSDSGELDLPSLANYMSADGLIVNNLWTKPKVLQSAREYLAPSKVRALEKNIHEAVPVKLERLKLKRKWKPGEPFNVVFTGRTTSTRNFEGVVDLFKKQFSFPLGKGDVRFYVSTNSEGGMANIGNIDFIDVQHNSREEFYAFLENTAHVAVNLSTVEDFSLSTYEPLSRGIPVIVSDQPWSDFLGADYPFKVTNFLSSYVAVSEFFKDYEGCYDRFEAWESKTWKDLVEGSKNISTADHLLRLTAEFEKTVIEYVSYPGRVKSYREMVELVTASDKQQIDMRQEALAHDCMTAREDWTPTPYTRRPHLLLLKYLFRVAGWIDCIEPGIMRRATMEG